MCTDWCRSFLLLLGSLACLGLGRVRIPWVTVGGRCEWGLERFGPLAYVRFVANAGLCLMSGDVGLFSLWRCFLPVPCFVMGIACLRFGNFGGRALFGGGRLGAVGIWGLVCGLWDSTVYAIAGRSVGTLHASGSVTCSCCP